MRAFVACAVLLASGCCGGNTCPNGFSISSDGKPITVDVADCDVRGNHTAFVVVTPSNGRDTCDVSAQLDDGTSVNLTVNFRPIDCCGRKGFEATPSGIQLNAAKADAGPDATPD